MAAIISHYEYLSQSRKEDTGAGRIQRILSERREFCRMSEITPKPSEVVPLEGRGVYIQHNGMTIRLETYPTYEGYTYDVSKGIIYKEESNE